MPIAPERLRALAETWWECCGDIHIPLLEAADEIERLLAVESQWVRHGQKQGWWDNAPPQPEVHNDRFTCVSCGNRLSSVEVYYGCANCATVPEPQ